MKLIAKAAAFTAAAAITATGLVGATGTSSSAATVSKSVTYNCDLSSFGVPAGAASQIIAAFNVPALPATVATGTAVPAQPLTATITVSPEVSTLISSVGADGGKLSGSVTGNAKFGTADVATSLTIPAQAVTKGAASTVNASGTLAGFTASQLGANAVSLPSAVSATLNSLIGAKTVNCTADPSSSLAVGSVNVVKPTLKATAKKVKAGHVAKIKVVTTPAQKGKAIAKIGKKKVAKAKLKNGKATLKVKGLKKTTKVKVFVGSLKTVVKVKVKK
jgi:hypothetical protein